MAQTQIYQSGSGPALFVRTEERNGEQGAVFALIKNRTIWFRWCKTLPDDFQLVHDPGSRAEANVLAAENGALIRQKEVLLECLASALGQLDERSAEQIRDLYRAKFRTADLISLTKSGDLTGPSVPEVDPSNQALGGR